MKKNFKLFAIAMMAVALAAVTGCKKDDPEVKEVGFDKCVLSIEITTDTNACQDLLDQFHLLGDKPGENLIGSPNCKSYIQVIADDDTLVYDIPAGNPTSLKKDIEFKKKGVHATVYMVVENLADKGGEKKVAPSYYYHASTEYNLYREDGTIYEGGHERRNRNKISMDITDVNAYLSATCPDRICEYYME